MSARFVCLVGLGLALLLGLAVPLPWSVAANGDEIVVTVLEGEAQIGELDVLPLVSRLSGSVRFPAGSAVRVITAPGSRAHVALPNGSEVELGAGVTGTFRMDYMVLYSGSVVVNVPRNVQGPEVKNFAEGDTFEHVTSLLSERRTTFGVRVDPESGDPTAAVIRGAVRFDTRTDTQFLGEGVKGTYRRSDKELHRAEFKPDASLFNDLDPVDGERDGTKAQGSENPGTGKPEQPKDKQKDDDKDKDQTSLPIPPSALSFQTASVSVPEGNSGLQVGSTTLNLAPPSTQVVTVQFAAVDGTATVADADYPGGGSGTLTFQAGETQKSFAFAWVGDTTPEPNEFYTVRLFNPTNATLGANATFNVWILNDDL